MIRRSTFLAAVLAAVALVAAGCGGPDDAEQLLSEACERQYEEVQAEETVEDVPVAESTEERLAQQSLVECAGQQFDTATADEEESSEEPSEEPGEEPGEEPAEEPAGEPAELSDDARQMFAETCGGCHTLEDAGTTGAVGPDLTGGGYDAEAVAEIIANGQGSMPPGLLQGDDAEAVAEYVAGASSLEE